jgi:hypothetical protein
VADILEVSLTEKLIDVNMLSNTKGAGSKCHASPAGRSNWQIKIKKGSLSGNAEPR